MYNFFNFFIAFWVTNHYFMELFSKHQNQYQMKNVFKCLVIVCSALLFVNCSEDFDNDLLVEPAMTMESSNDLIEDSIDAENSRIKEKVNSTEGETVRIKEKASESTGETVRIKEKASESTGETV